MFIQSKQIDKNILFQIQTLVIALILSGLATNSLAAPVYEHPVIFQEPIRLSAQASKQLKKIAARRAVVSVRAVQVQLSQLHTSRPFNNQPIEFNVDSNLLLGVKFDSKTKCGANCYIWDGSVPGDQSSSIILATNKKKVVGTIRQGSQIYALEPLKDGNHALIHIDQSQFPPDHPAQAKLGDSKSAKAGAKVTQQVTNSDLWAGERNLFSTAPLDSTLLDKASRTQVDTIQARPTTTSMQVVKIALPLLMSDTNQLVNLNLAPGIDLPVAFTNLDKSSTSEFIWEGIALNDIGSQVILAVRGSSVVGTIRTSTEAYAIEPVGGGNHALIHIDSSKFPPEHPQGSNGAESSVMFDQPGDVVSTDNLSDTALKKTTINVLVAYTAKAAAAHGDINLLISTAVKEANKSYQNSALPITLKLVHKYQTKYSESGDYETDLSRFRINGDKKMDEVHSKRNTYKADVAVLLVDQDSACGLASAIMAKSSTAFAAVHYSCATGYYSFAHEIGHLQGAHHDRAVDSSSGPACVDFSHGYVNAVKGWRTIMAYNNPACAGDGCIRILYWSNPSVSYLGDPTGLISQSDNVACLTQTRAKVAKFK